MHVETSTEVLHVPDIGGVDALDCGDNHLHLVVDIADSIGPPICSWCGAEHTSVHSRGQMRAEDLPLLGRRVFLYLEKRKCRCPDGETRGDREAADLLHASALCYGLTYVQPRTMNRSEAQCCQQYQQRDEGDCRHNQAHLQRQYLADGAAP